MGCDGGTIPTRDELVKTKKRPEQKDKDSVRLFKWQHCHLSHQKLSKPIVACQLGFLYNKEVIIEKLLDSKSDQEASSSRGTADHIKSLKDVRELNLTDNPAFNRQKDKATVGDGGYNDKLTSPYVCPIAGVEMNGKFKFVFDWAKGNVLSERGHNIVIKTDENVKIPEENYIIINPETDEEFDLLHTRMVSRQARAAVEKAAKKAAKRKLKEDGTKEETKTSKPENGIKDAKVPKEKEVKKEKTKSTVQNDPTKSEVYKSLFSSHKSAANKPKAHWVTFDPRYN